MSCSCDWRKEMKEARESGNDFWIAAAFIHRLRFHSFASLPTSDEQVKKNERRGNV